MIKENPRGESKVGGISVRAILAILVIVTVCALAFLKVEPPELIKYLVISIVSTYFAHAQRKADESDIEQPAERRRPWSLFQSTK
jgi:hypothetical protein